MAVTSKQPNLVKTKIYNIFGQKLPHLMNPIQTVPMLKMAQNKNISGYLSKQKLFIYSRGVLSIMLGTLFVLIFAKFFAI